MARKDALLKLHQRLIEQRKELKQKVAEQLDSAGERSGPGDLGDLSLIDAEQEMGTQLAAFESRELNRIEKAIEAIRQGTYGTCEYCEKPIPIARLRALPHTSCCIKCQREQEINGGPNSDGSEGDWESAWEYQARENDQELTVRDVRMDSD
ncbi:TraR/DksA C4-type zinc finger protein [Thalassoglobus sp. JC818]|uniref:TraR/DksA family transcriptional regulator n=1 Tax=Thalassoglobus sp. JC818 TaxID=3232136 RepID=UPI003458EAA4